eukprot:TRINITY_DN5242_c0_g1_i2.p1 TRINITY_DN5242_c0_g1~~TRINITY_DN5242_c0_g1_i2.p1  ORF type:complete len:405 (+),score=53.90 TRINITY_DN5242_c0_g1_i2:33-1247(+)
MSQVGLDEEPIIDDRNDDPEIADDVRTEKSKGELWWQKNQVLVQAAIGFVALIGLVLAVGFVTSSAKANKYVILISIDGFRWDYFEHYPNQTANLQKIARSGVKAEYIKPSFPTKTFPNHYTIVTGLYPESHGIISNSFYDPKTHSEFSATLNSSALNDGWWFGGEPIWATVQKQGMKAGCVFWLGCDATIGGHTPDYNVKFNRSMPYSDRISQVIGWLSQPQERPNLITIYFDQVDIAGHTYGPEPSRPLEYAIASVDEAIGEIFEKVSSLDIGGSVDFVVVSDHGMTEVSENRVIFLDDYVDISATLHVELSTISLIYVNDTNMTDTILSNLTSAHPNMTAYSKDQIPIEFHYANNSKISEIVVICDLGWTLTTRAEFNKNPTQFNGGNHGYSNLYQDMRYR